MRDKMRPRAIHMVGCGGVGSYLLPILLKFIARTGCVLHLHDGDTLEEGNLDRQLFPEECVGLNKAEAMQGLYPDASIEVHPEYLTRAFTPDRGSLMLCCADNHVARKACLEIADRIKGHVIVGANEYTDAEAYYYCSMWGGGHLDPRVYYPEILTDESDDPTRPASCQGPIAEEHPQLVLSNFAAADYVMRLLYFYFVHRRSMPKGSEQYWPVRHQSNHSKQATITQEQLYHEHRERTDNAEAAATDAATAADDAADASAGTRGEGAETSAEGADAEVPGCVGGVDNSNTVDDSQRVHGIPDAGGQPTPC